jgi:hypothetical protein
MVARFPGIPDAAMQLEALGWRAGAHRQFHCDPVPAAGVNWLDLSIHLFGDDQSAAAAVPFFAYARTVGTQLSPAFAPRFGDSTAALSGPSENGTEYTLYLSSGPLLFRVSAVATNDDPQPLVEMVMRALVDDLDAAGRQWGAPAPRAPLPRYTVDEQTGDTILVYPDGQVVPVLGQDVSEPPAPNSAPNTAEQQVQACAESPAECSFDATGQVQWGSPAYGCDWNYATQPAGCVPYDQGDYDCPDLAALGLRTIQVIGEDWMQLDVDGDGIGCEPLPTS